MNKTLTVIAGSDIDTFYDVESFPKAGDACIAREAGERVGGCILNVGTVASYLGMNVRVLDYLKKNDPGSRMLLQSMIRAGMDIAGIRYGDDVTNGRCLILRHGDEKCILVIPTVRPPFAENDKEIRDILETSDYLYSLGHTMIKSFGETPEMVYGAQRKGAELILDGSSQYQDPREIEITKHCDRLFLNAQSYARLSECLGRDAAAFLLENGTKTVCVTDGADGSTLYFRDGIHYQPAAKLEKVVDSTGAGDTFAAAFLTALAEGRPLEEAHRRASGAGALACLHEGALSPSLNAQALERFLSDIA